MDGVKKLDDIGGWLLFFIISLTIFSPLFNFFILLVEIEFLSFMELLETLATISLSILAGIFLWTKEPHAVQFTKIVLITNFIIIFVTDLIFLNSPDYFFHAFIYSIIWILYLYKSERVYQVYGNLKEKSGGRQIWSTLAIIYAIVLPIYGIIFSVTSLIKLSKNSKLRGRTISIIALIISILVLFLFFGYGLSHSVNAINVPEITELRCNIYCSNISLSSYYLIEYDYVTSSFICYCLDGLGNDLDQTSFR